MKKQTKYTKELTHDFTRDIEQLISASSIQWKNSKEAVWERLNENLETQSTQKATSKTVYYRVMQYAAAAVMFIAVSTTAFAYLYTNTVTTKLAQEIRLQLPDKSVVSIKEKSTLSYKPFWWKLNRKINLTGEAFFTVEKGSKFEVVSNKGKTTVLGTQFTVFTRNNDYLVTCISGKVQVVEFANKNAVVIVGGQKATLQQNGTFTIEKQAKINFQQQKWTPKIEQELNTILHTKESNIEATKKDIQITQNVDKTIEKPQQTTQTKKPERKETIVIGEEYNPVLPIQEKNTSIKQDNNAQETTKTDAEQIKSNKATKFKHSLTESQLELLENKHLDKKNKRKLFMESLSDEQRKLLEDEKNIRRKDEKNLHNKTLQTETETGTKTNMREQMRENISQKELNGLQKNQLEENRNNKPPIINEFRQNHQPKNEKRSGK